MGLYLRRDHGSHHLCELRLHLCLKLLLLKLHLSKHCNPVGLDWCLAQLLCLVLSLGIQLSITVLGMLRDSWVNLIIRVREVIITDIEFGLENALALSHRGVDELLGLPPGFNVCLGGSAFAVKANNKFLGRFGQLFGQPACTSRPNSNRKGCWANSYRLQV
jgi:hypothetical protein